MPYIGRDAQTAQSQNKIIDDISSSFNGSTTSFALLVGGVAPAPFPATSQNLLISVGGVIQEPDGTGTNGYQLTGANIVFSAAPASGQSFFGVVLAGADYVNAGANFPDGDAATPSITFSQDLDTGLFRSGSGTTSFTSNNNRIADFGTTEIVFNEDGDDIDFRVEGDTEANLLFVEAGTDRVGIGTSSPSIEFDVRGNVRVGRKDAGNAELQIGSGATGDRAAFIDMVGDTTYTDYSLRLVRYGGANADSALVHRGTGDLRIESVDTGADILIDPTSKGNVYVGTVSPGTAQFGVKAQGNGARLLELQNERPWTFVQVNSGASSELSLQCVSNKFFSISGSSDGVNFTDTARFKTGDSKGVSISGSLSKSSGSFRIDHPLPSKTATHDLVHSFVEAPDASNLYAGMVDLVDGRATVNIDTAHRMTEGTFEALNTLQSWSSSNESGYAPVKCSVSGNLLTIECQDATSTDTVYYEVRGIRKDQHMFDTDWTDENGRVITEPLKDTGETEDPE